MNIYSTPYGRTLTKRMKEVEGDIKKFIQANNNVIIPTSYRDIFTVTAGDENIIQWNFPLIIDGKAYVDARPYLNLKGEPKNKIEYDQLMVRAMLELDWERNRERASNYDIQVSAVYGSWISRTITAAYNSTPGDMYIMKAAFTYLYMYFFLDEREQDEFAKGELDVSLLKRLTRYTDLTTDFLNNTIFADSDNGLLRSFIASNKQNPFMAVMRWLEDHLESPIPNMNDNTIRTLLINRSWFGHQSGEVVTIAMYHPPMLMTMIEKAINNNAYGRTSIGIAVKDNKRKAKVDMIENYIKNLIIEFGSDDD